MGTNTGLSGFYSFLAQPLFFRSRLFLAALVVPLLLAFLVPLWRIELSSPQHPQGLTLDVYAHTVKGGHDGADIREINILNQSMGVQALVRRELTDLDWIPFALGLIAILTLRCAAIGDVRSLVDVVVSTLYVALFSVTRFFFKLRGAGAVSRGTLALAWTTAVLAGCPPGDSSAPSPSARSSAVATPQPCVPRSAEKLGIHFLRICPKGEDGFWISAVPIGCSAGKHDEMSCPIVSALAHPVGSSPSAIEPVLAAVIDADTAGRLCFFRLGTTRRRRRASCTRRSGQGAPCRPRRGARLRR